MNRDLDNSEFSSEININNDETSSLISNENNECVSTSEKEEEDTSEANRDSKSHSSSQLSEISDEEASTDNTLSLCKRNKIEEDIKPIASPAPFGSKSVFGSAAKNTVSFNSIASNPTLAPKNLFAEDIAEAPIVNKEIESSEYEVITGEEDEMTIISIKGKLFEFSSESKNWHERGIGMFKLNKSKESEKFRIIMRTDGVQKLVLNSNLFPSMLCEVVQEKNIRFSANNFESKIQTFILRMKNSDDASNLENSLKNAIASLTTDEDC